ncbi:MAG: hypothetical protein WC612_08420 [Bdellovibrionales bacterium]|jgi:rod shape-determining protein MreD
MSSSFLQKSGQLVRHALPFGITVVFIGASVLVLPVPYLSGIAPMLGLVAVYYWAIYRPDLLRPFFVFWLGLLNDVLQMLPIGLSAILFLGLYQLVFSQRRLFVGQTFPIVWTGFALVALMASLVQWFVLSLFEGQGLSVQPVFLQFLLTVFLFPLPAWLLIHLQRAFLTQE